MVQKPLGGTDGSIASKPGLSGKDPGILVVPPGKLTVHLSRQRAAEPVRTHMVMRLRSTT